MHIPVPCNPGIGGESKSDRAQRNGRRLTAAVCGCRAQ